MIRKGLFLLLAVVLLFLHPAFAQAKDHRVVFGLTSPDEMDWKLTINNIHSLLAGLGTEHVEVEVVVYGPGIVFLKSDSPDLAAVKELETAHVHFMACANSMNARHWAKADLVPGVEVVPAGIVEVVTKQEQGWTYIKAGR